MKNTRWDDLRISGIITILSLKDKNHFENTPLKWKNSTIKSFNQKEKQPNKNPTPKTTVCVKHDHIIQVQK